MAQMKEQIKTLEKELNKMEISRVQTLVIRMLKELSEDLDSIKKIQSEMKGTLIEIRNNLQGNNSRVKASRVRPRITSMFWNIRTQKITNQNNKKKKESPKK